MFDLEPLVVSDFPKAKEFWGGVLSTVGYAPQHDFVELQTYGKTAHCPNFSIAQGDRERLLKRVIRLQLDDSEDVEELYKKAVAIGAKGLKVPELVDGDCYMGAFLDLDGNTVEVYCQEDLVSE